MKKRTRLLLSLASGIAAAVIALAYASSAASEADRARDEVLARFGGEMVEVCVATRDIDPGEVIDEGNVAVEEWVASLLPQDAETTLADVIGKTATSCIPKRSVICPAYFEVHGSDAEIPAGKVAVSVSADAAHAVGGALEQGDDVEVYASLDGVADLLCTASIVDTSILADEDASLSWVTLAVEPDSVKELLIATSRAQVTLVEPGAEVATTSEGEDA